MHDTDPDYQPIEPAATRDGLILQLKAYAEEYRTGELEGREIQWRRWARVFEKAAEFLTDDAEVDKTAELISGRE